MFNQQLLGYLTISCFIFLTPLENIDAAPIGATKNPYQNDDEEMHGLNAPVIDLGAEDLMTPDPQGIEWDNLEPTEFLHKVTKLSLKNTDAAPIEKARAKRKLFPSDENKGAEDLMGTVAKGIEQNKRKSTKFQFKTSQHKMLIGKKRLFPSDDDELKGAEKLVATVDSEFEQNKELQYKTTEQKLRVFRGRLLNNTQKNQYNSKLTETTSSMYEYNSGSKMRVNNEDNRNEDMNLTIQESFYEKPLNHNKSILRDQLNLQYGTYYPGKDLSTVCFRRSTLYNIPKVKNYLNIQSIDSDPWNKVGWKNWMDARPLYMTLRKRLYAMGNSEHCHVKDNDKWRKYLECSLMRNQRMEYMIPQYPLHQVGYHALTVRIAY